MRKQRLGDFPYSENMPLRTPTNAALRALASSQHFVGAALISSEIWLTSGYPLMVSALRDYLLSYREIPPVRKLGPKESRTMSDSSRHLDSDAAYTPLTSQDYDVVDERILAVVRELPFTVETDADMGGTFHLQIDLGSRSGIEDDPHDRAGIEPEDQDMPYWWIEIQHVDGSDKQFYSDFDIETKPEVVADWIATVARREGCPAAMTPTSIASMGFASSPTNATKAHPATIKTATAGETALDNEVER